MVDATDLAVVAVTVTGLVDVVDTFVVGGEVVATTTGRNVATGVRRVVVVVTTFVRMVVVVNTLGRTVVVVAMALERTVVVVVRRVRGIVVTVDAVTMLVVVVEDVVVVVDVEEVVASPDPDAEATVTEIVRGDPVNVVCGFPAESATENDVAAVSVDCTVPPPAVAVEVTVNVQTVDEVWITAEIAEIPIRSKSTPAPVSSVVQSMSSFPVTVKVIEAEEAVDAGTASVTVGAVESIVTVPVEAADKLLAESAAYTL